MANTRERKVPALVDKPMDSVRAGAMALSAD